jgi:L-alanine-DL-glutamate epimerase-like enolase superfamily enzyme
MTEYSTPSLDSTASDVQHIRIVGLDVAVCALEMPYPVRLGPVVYTTRDYVALRMRTDAGIDGYALGYSRGTPIPAALQTLAPEILGRDARMIRSIVVGIRQSHAPAWGAFVRAVSLVDVALWDIAARAARLPLFKLLGGYRDTIPVMAVAGYYLDRRSVEDVEEEIMQRAGDGFKTIKIGIPAVDPRADEAFVSRLRRALDNSIDLGIDAHSAWTDLETALAACQRLDSLGLSFIEDPCSPQSWRLMADLQARIRTPLAAGEEASMIEQHRDLLDAVTILRVDATANGGLSDVMLATQMAAAAGRSVSPHVYAPLHSHLAGAFPNVRQVEIIPAEVGADPFHRLLRSEPAIRNGMLLLDDSHGNGIDLDWEAVSAHASDILSLTD